MTATTSDAIQIIGADRVGGTDRTADLARFVTGLTYTALPAEVAEFMDKCVLDFAGVATGGALWAESTPAFVDGVSALAGDGPVTVVGRTFGRPVEYAALLNGVAAHSLEFDDTDIAAKLHPGAPIIAAALAMAEQTDPTGTEFLTALAAGYEVCCRIGAALRTGAYARGFHPTGVAGIFGAVAAGARLHGFTAEQTGTAFGLAGSMASGSMQYLVNGSWNKRMHGGLAAHNALLAVTFTAKGVFGSVEALDGEHGVLRAYSDDSDPDALTRGLGTQWALLGTGIKPYPACRLTHGSIDAALQLRDVLPDGPADDATITLAIPALDDGIVGGTADNKFAPSNTVEGQFSIYFQVAATLLRGRPDWSIYEHLTDPAIRRLTRRITTVTDDTLRNAGVVLTYRPAVGDPIEVRVDTPTGDPGYAIAWETLEAKFHSLAVAAFDGPARDRIITAVRALPDDGPIGALSAALRPSDTTGY